jgi:hypothetical protein
VVPHAIEGCRIARLISLFRKLVVVAGDVLVCDRERFGDRIGDCVVALSQGADTAGIRSLAAGAAEH